MKVLTEPIKNLMGMNKQLEMENYVLESSAISKTIPKMRANSSQPAQARVCAAPPNSHFSITEPSFVKEPHVQQQCAHTLHKCAMQIVKYD